MLKDKFVMNKRLGVSIFSEIGELEGVILHKPGQELQNMTPETAERALYSDILNLSVASNEYSQLNEVLNKLTNTYQVNDLLANVVNNEKIKQNLIDKICINENILDIKEYLLDLPDEELARQLIEGVKMKKNNLTKFLKKERYTLQPLHNFFFTRDASVAIRNNVLISRMASKVREREAIIMEAIFDYSQEFSTKTINPINSKECVPELSIEGGDVLVVRDDILLIGIGGRTTSYGVDFILTKLKELKQKSRHIIIQELPLSPESFIHLDMVFTFLDVDKCMVYEPLILKPNKYQTVHIKIDNGEVTSIEQVENIPTILKKLGIDLKPIYCGGQKDSWIQEREQWHSGANFFAVAPGKVIGYGRNIYTVEEMSNNGFEIIKAKDILKNKVDLSKYDKYMICLEGSELPRGGGGARCMTMPIRRKAVDW